MNLHSPERQLIELKIEHADLNALADMAVHALPMNELSLGRLKNVAYTFGTKYRNSNHLSTRVSQHDAACGLRFGISLFVVAARYML
jgi:hypothetical protein